MRLARRVVVIHQGILLAAIAGTLRCVCRLLLSVALSLTGYKKKSVTTGHGKEFDKSPQRSRRINNLCCFRYLFLLFSTMFFYLGKQINRQ